MITEDKLRVKRDEFDLKRQEPEERSRYREREKLQREFVSKFPQDRIPLLSLDDYVEGKLTKEGQINRDTFCYWVEVQTTKLGQIKGSNASKFGVFFDKETEHYKFTEKFKSFKSESAAFIFLRDEIVRLIEAGSTKNLDVIREIDISPMFKGKILSLYHPEKYLNIFSKAYIDYFLGEIGLSVPNGGTDVLDERELLFAFKANDEIMSKWTMYEFTNFLYEACGSPKKSSKIPEAPRKYMDAENFPPARKTGGDSSEVDMDDLFNSKSLENATVFEFGYIAEPQQFEVRQIRFHIVSPKGQGEFEAATFIKRGKRKEKTVNVNQLVVIQGWGHPKLDINTTHFADGKAKFPAFSNKWNDLLDQHLATLVPPFQLIVDGRKRPQLTHKPVRGFPIGELQTLVNDRVGLQNSTIDDIPSAPIGSKVPGRTPTAGSRYQRDEKVRRFVIEQAKGACEYCRELGFLLPDGSHYLEAHHIIALANQGSDTVDNVIALCPSDHREAHYGKKAVAMENEMIEIIKKRNPPRRSSHKSAE